MLKEQQHEEYISQVKLWLSILYPNGPPPIHAHVAWMLMLVNLSKIRQIIRHLYSPFGRPARIPEKMLRSFLCMVLCGYTSLTN